MFNFLFQLNFSSRPDSINTIATALCYSYVHYYSSFAPGSNGFYLNGSSNGKKIIGKRKKRASVFHNYSSVDGTNSHLSYTERFLLDYPVIKMSAPSLQSIKYTNEGGSSPQLKVLDQLLIPHEKVYIEIPDVEMAYTVIKTMQIRGTCSVAYSVST